jgi:hypothetical protein
MKVWEEKERGERKEGERERGRGRGGERREERGREERGKRERGRKGGGREKAYQAPMYIRNAILLDELRHGFIYYWIWQEPVIQKPLAKKN